MTFVRSKALKHFGKPDSAVDPHILERLDTGCQFVGDIVAEMGPPPPPDHEWAAWEVRPTKRIDGNKVITFETNYDHLIEGALFIPAKSGRIVRVCLFSGHRLVPWMVANNMCGIAEYIEEVRATARIVVFEVGNPKGCYVRALGVLPMQPGGSA